MTEKNIRNFWKHVKKQDGDNSCWLWGSEKDKKGYGKFRIMNYFGKRVWFRAHRLSWELENGPIPAGLCILHKCDVPACLRPDHLFIGSKADNNRDMTEKGRRVVIRGEQLGTSKLTEEQVRAICGWIDLGMSQRDVAKRFGVSHSVIGHIVRGTAWRHIPRPAPLR